MDSRGHWHNEPNPILESLRSDPERSNARERPVITLDIGEMVAVVKANGERVMAVFNDAHKNKVTLHPQDNGQPMPYLELAEHVQLERANGESVKAQVWDNRRGALILRTLPVF